MNPFQMAQQIQSKLQAVVWPGVGGKVVFGDDAVLVTTGVPEEDQIPAGFPWALVVPGTGTPDPDQPQLIQQVFSVITAAEVSGDPMGEHALIGGSTSTLLESGNRGILEVAARVRSAVEDLTGVDGARILLSSINTSPATKLGEGSHIVFDELGLSAWCASDLHYAEPQEITRVGTVFTWEGAHCSNRFDFLDYQLVLNAANAPADTSDGTIIYTGTAPNHTVGGPPLSGNFYGAFARYNARGGATSEGQSTGALVGSFIQI